MVRFSALFLYILTAVAQNQECDFSHLASDLPLIANETTDVTDDFRAAPELWAVAVQASPMVKRIYASEDPYFSIFLGWIQSDEPLDKFSRLQVLADYSNVAALEKARAEKLGHAPRKG